MRKFGLSGAHGTGKSTLVRLLQSNLGDQICITPEAPRVLVDEIGENEAFQRESNTLSRQMIILTKHLQQELQFLDCSLLLTDRTLVDHWAYTEVIHGADSEYVMLRKAIKNIVAHHCKTFEKFIYIPIEFDIEQDGVRESDTEFQLQIDRKIRELYDELNLNIKEISGNIPERYSLITSYMGVNI